MKVLIPQDVAEEGKSYLRERGYEIKMGSGTTEEILKREVADCTAILARTAPFTEEVLRAGKSLRVIARHGVGVDNIDLKTADELGIIVTNTPEANAGSVAEHTIGLLIALAKNFTICDRELRKGNFEIRNRVPGLDLEDKTLGIVGIGRVGSQVAQIAAKGLNMNVLGYDPFVPAARFPATVQRVSSWEEIIKAADFLTLHLPANAQNRGSVGAAEFALMKHTAYLINTSRGDIINEKNLIKALEFGQIAGAALDVFTDEPPDKNNPLLTLENVILTPHNASLTKECMARMSLHAAIGIDEVVSGKTPTWPVNDLKKQVRK